MIGQTISHYKITAKLGSGGMGEVYLATDTSLDRQVALKFLPDALQKDPEARERLIREAKAASRLHHPNILTIHAVEHHEGRDFIVMEYVEGKPLTESSRDTHRSIPQVLDLAIAVAEGLHKAHSAGVIHRDLKPANILVDRDGVPRLVDFGLAKVRGTDKLTKTGSTLGTVAYMSPEQALGQDIDARSDIFSFGVVLHELVTGRTPFQGTHEAAITYAIVNEAAEPMSRFKSGVPAELERIVAKSLAKSPDERYQSVADMAADLRALQRVQGTSGSQSPQPRPRARKRTVVVAIVLGVAILAVAAALVTRHFLSAGPAKSSGRTMLAVLPFENLGSPDQEYFADGITDEITGKLAAIRDLGVISRTSTMPYKRSTKGLREIAKELGVDYVLEGTILWDRGGDTSRVRILPQLIRVSDDTHLWAETYQRPLIDIFAVQAEIATQIAAAMNITLRGPEVAALNDMPTKNLEAYQAYLRGIDYFNAPDMTFANGQLAVQMFERAARLDTTFVQAYAYLGMAHAQMYGYGHDASEGRLTQAKLATDRALALQPGSPRAHQALSTYYYWGFKDYERTLRELEYAEVGILNDAWIIDRKAFIHARQGRSKMALEEMRRAFALSPRDAGLARDLAYLYTLSRDYELAERFCDQSIALAPDQTLAYARKAGNYYAWRGDTAAARATLAAIPDQQADDTRWRWVVHHIFTRDYSAVLASLDSMRPSADLWTVSGYVHKLLNAPEQSRMCFDSARVNGEKELAERPNNPNTHGGLGFIYACLGHKDEAIREGMRGVDLLPVSKDAVDGPAGVETLVEIYIEVGEYDAALDQIEYLLSIPCGVSVSLLRLDPLYDPLRKLPRFQKLLEQPDKVF